MVFSNRVYSTLVLSGSILFILCLLFVLLIVPILPLDDDNILHTLSQTPVLVFSGCCGLLFCGSLSVFTVVVMFQGRWERLNQIVKSKVK